MRGLTLTSLLLAAGARAAPASDATNAAQLNPNCAPGGNFDLSKWSLQLPIGKPGSPTTIGSGQLSGCGGYTNQYFSTQKSDGALVMKVPSLSSGCVKTPNSAHCRTEFRESNPSKWSPNAGKNRLSASLIITQSHGDICVGQIHIDDSISSKPVAELYVNQSGAVNMGVQTCRTCSQQRTAIGNVTPGKQFSYEIRYEGGKLSVALNGGAFKGLSTYNLNSPNSYFKVGNYNQADDASEVHFYSINVTHG
ncbi:hypothetical protein PT974_09429 [Cladobotryum mycophilum]|uniref:Alginate lyase 2 domain-containing protein n=1 Tax=Cladobotryum mycophilum TaxID=491253 RepID=A0ABR0SG91_9HYPO